MARFRSAFLLLMLLALVSGCDGLLAGLESQAPPDGSQSAQRLEPGPFTVESADFELVDTTRPTMENGDVPGADSRTLAVTVWSPVDADGLLPLIVYSHGFTGSRREMVFLLEHLASHGYLVAGLDFPLTNGEAPGGPNPGDLASQPGDVRFLIDSLLEGKGETAPFAPRIDAERIGLAGLSYGGLTTTLLAFHPREADPRVKGAISIAGPAQMFTPVFFEGGGPEFLMLAGTEDALVPFELNAADLPAKAPGARLLALQAGTHLGFIEMATTAFRFSHNPDAIACEGIRAFEGEGDVDANPFAGLSAPEDGIDFGAWVFPCQADLDHGLAMRPERQHTITALGVRAFLDSLFAPDIAARANAARFLREVLPAELSDVSLHP